MNYFVFSSFFSDSRALIYGLLQAMGAGGAVAITLLNDAQCPLVGVAVASTFLPPHINTGLLWAYACHLQWRGLGQDYITYNTTSGHSIISKPAWRPQEKYNVHYYEDMRYESIALGGVSLLLTYVNVIGMIFVAYIMLWVSLIICNQMKLTIFVLNLVDLIVSRIIFT